MRAGPAVDICGTPPSYRSAKSRFFDKNGFFQYHFFVVHLVAANWNLIYKELLRWQTLLEESPLTNYLPYSRGTGLLYTSGQERMRKPNTRDCSHHQAKGERREKPHHKSSHAKRREGKGEESDDAH